MNLQKQNRIGSKKYTDWVKSLPSVLTDIPADDPHHMIGHGTDGIGIKTSDIFTFPLTRTEHTQLHNMGWRTWEEVNGDQRRFVLMTIEQAFRDGILVVK